MSDLKLWEIPEAIDILTEELVDPETGEMLTEEEVIRKIDELQMEAAKKTEYIAKQIIIQQSYQDSLRERKKEFDKKLKAAERRELSLKNYLKFALNGKKYTAEDASVSVSYRNTKNVVSITNLEDIPGEYFKTPHYESNLNKTAIKEMLMNGDKVPGAELIDKVSVIVK